MYYAQTLASLAKHYKISMSDPWRKIPKKIQDVILFGSDEDEIKFSYDDGYEAYTTKKTFEGVVNNLERRYLETDSDWKREEIAQYQSDTKCERCNGYRLKDEALCVKINELNISQVTEKSIFDAKEWFRSLEVKLDKRQIKIAQHILKEINDFNVLSRTIEDVKRGEMYAQQRERKSLEKSVSNLDDFPPVHLFKVGPGGIN